MCPMLRGHHFTHTTVIVPGYPVESVFDGLDTVVEVRSLSVCITLPKLPTARSSNSKVEASRQFNSTSCSRLIRAIHCLPAADCHHVLVENRFRWRVLTLRSTLGNESSMT